MADSDRQSIGWGVLMDAAQSNGRNAGHAAPAKGLITYPTSNFTATAGFLGTENPRQLRAIAALLRRPLPRKQLDDVAGASNSPQLVAQLRARGLDVPCQRVSFVDRDGRLCRPGVYCFTTADRRKVYRWMASR